MPLDPLVDDHFLIQKITTTWHSHTFKAHPIHHVLKSAEIRDADVVDATAQGDGSRMRIVEIAVAPRPTGWLTSLGEELLSCCKSLEKWGEPEVVGYRQS